MDDLDDISIHALREEGDDVVQVCKLGDIEFLSTPSARRATWPVQGCARQAGISIHALREEGDSPCVAWEQGHSISIHALREEGDESSKKADSGKGISIHALREEGDKRCVFQNR